uniref:Lunapark zinc ribbon domain-containing protein n=1 Tax=Aegilops tauschii TaxID=37682 RepID=M8CZ98_AEGTA
MQDSFGSSQVTCQLIGIVFEEKTPEELQNHATVKPSVVELLLEISKYCDFYLMETVLDDKSEENALMALENAGLFKSGGLMKEKVLFCSSEVGRTSFVRQLESDFHIDASLEIISQLSGYIFFPLEQIAAVGHAIMTTRSPDIPWQMRAARVLPMFLVPALAALIYSAITSIAKFLDNRDQHTLEKLRAERQAKIDELKERTNYYTTQQLIQRYDLDPAAKAAAASVLASKLGADSGLRVFLGDESNVDGSKSNDQHGQTSGLRQRKPAHSGHGSGPTHASEPSDGSSIYDGNESPTANRTVEHFRGHAGNDGGWLARVAALLVGEDPTQCFALICGNCHMHNGLARKEDFAFVTYYCPHCNALNGSRQQEDGEMVTPTDRSFGNSVQAGASLADSGVSSPVGRSLPTVEELPAESSGASNSTIAEQPRAESSSAANNLPPTVEVPPADQLAS